jgi:hypothetical protein
LRVRALHERGVEGQAIWQLLVEEHGFTGSYSSVKRFLRRLAPGRRYATLPLEVGPDEEAQVKRNALAGRAFRDVHEGNRHLLRCCLEVPGRRVHGTTKQIPLALFERAALLLLPVSPWALTEWKRAKFHGDCHVVFDGA